MYFDHPYKLIGLKWVILLRFLTRVAEVGHSEEASWLLKRFPGKHGRNTGKPPWYPYKGIGSFIGSWLGCIKSHLYIYISIIIHGIKSHSYMYIYNYKLHSYFHWFLFQKLLTKMNSLQLASTFHSPIHPCLVGKGQPLWMRHMPWDLLLSKRPFAWMDFPHENHDLGDPNGRMRFAM